MEVVIDLKRYMGRWYEIASFPNFFQPKDGENTRATYTLNEDGTVHVLNETEKVSIEGTAYKTDPNSDEAKFKTRMDNEIYNMLVDKAKEEGYDVSNLCKTVQSDPPPEGDEAPKDTKGVWWIKSLFGK